MGFPTIYGGVTIGGPGGEKITPPGGVPYPGSCGPVITVTGVMHIPANFPSSRMHAAITPRDFAPSNNPPGRVHTAGGRAASREMCRHVSPRFRSPPHLLSPRTPAAAVVDAAAAVAECTRPRRAT